MALLQRILSTRRAMITAPISNNTQLTSTLLLIIPLSKFDISIKGAAHPGSYLTLSIINYPFIDPVRCQLGSLHEVCKSFGNVRACRRKVFTPFGQFIVFLDIFYCLKSFFPNILVTYKNDKLIR